jgi:hypothetical protein
VWLPVASAVWTSGLEQDANGLPSRLHSNVEPASLELNANVASVSVVGSAGPESMLVTGAEVSTVQA